VFSFLLPLGHPALLGPTIASPQLWLPARDDARQAASSAMVPIAPRYDDAAASPAADAAWHSVRVRLDWSGSNTPLLGAGRPSSRRRNLVFLRVEHDGARSVAMHRALLPDDYDGFRHLYLFNWIAAAQPHHGGGATTPQTTTTTAAGGDAGEAPAEVQLADLVVEEHLPPGTDDRDGDDFSEDVRQWGRTLRAFLHRAGAGVRAMVPWLDADDADDSEASDDAEDDAGDEESDDDDDAHPEIDALLEGLREREGDDEPAADAGGPQQEADDEEDDDDE